MIDFNENSVIKILNYLINCTIRDKKYCQIIISTYNKYIFITNDKV